MNQQNEAPSVLILSEEALGADDARRLVGLHSDQQFRYHVLVPADTDRNLLADVLDHLSLLELGSALEAVRGHGEQDRAEAAVALDSSLRALRTASADATGQVVEGDPVDAVRRIIEKSPGVQELIVVTRPHAVEDTFHRDWASRARDTLGLPVLHVYAGSSWLG